MQSWTQSRAVLLALGIGAGLVAGWHLSGLWPHVPLHASATQGDDNFIIATGLVDEHSEALYVLDGVTRDLRATVLNTQLGGKFTAFFTRNIDADFALGTTKNPKFLMVTGLAELPRGFARQNIHTLSVLYVAEATTGQVASYAIPWNPSVQSARKPQAGELIPLDKQNFRTAVVRD